MSEVEVRLDDGDVKGVSLENVIRVADERLRTTPGARAVGHGTWITMGEALAAWSAATQ